ncbi:hypothetical protein MetMK1DRAFT_00017070 [Metallosphaera yellowstonensis MK1]|uniref:Uncharacterized protein n=1 Tax=Metallosphaera yellowstonensis MK1 TaxID=671065 RepID=H2C584_9CREN|nr:hypothetical protein [Metallosphaera yellowstonensis]EHP68961.1 hypothetical protein MetMK1DRAFT_00017070 [Metallosphaera yellowstonensis MK1]
MGISGRWYGKSVLARSFSFQRLPAEKIRNEERLIREAKVRLVREINRLGVVRGRGGAGRLTGLILMVLVGGRASIVS